MNISDETTITTNLSSTSEELQPIKLNDSVLTMIENINSTIDTADNATYYGNLFYSLYTNLIGYLQNLTSTFVHANQVKLDNTTDIMNSSFDVDVNVINIT